MKIKVKFIDENCKFKIHKNGDLIDLRAAEDIILKAPQGGTLKKKIVNGEVVDRFRNVSFDSKLISLGIAMELPKGMKANLYPRSSTFKNFGIMLVNGTGQVDCSYNGDYDIWKFHAIAFRNAVIHKGDRIAQFEIVPSMFATTWQKLKWLFNGKPKFKVVDNLNNKSRGGFGSTNID